MDNNLALDNATSQIIDLCDKNGWDYFIYGYTFIIRTPYSFWKFELEESGPFSLYHRNFSQRINSHKHYCEYHNQGRIYTLEEIGSMFSYIRKHDDNFINKKKRAFR